MEPRDCITLQERVLGCRISFRAARKMQSSPRIKKIEVNTLTSWSSTRSKPRNGGMSDKRTKKAELTLLHQLLLPAARSSGREGAPHSSAKVKHNHISIL
eukprot:1158881-Pelagomonas_calceolata.AAC.4